MRTTIIRVTVAILCCVLTAVIVAQRLNARRDAELAAQRAAWEQEKADLLAALENAKGVERVVVLPSQSPAPAPVVAPAMAKTTPAEIVARLRKLKPGATSRIARQAIHELENLIALGPAALPAIREMLARNEDVDFLPAQGKGGRGAVPDEFVLPPTLRFGLLDAAKQIGGPEGEAVLAEILGTTSRAVELAWIARALQDTVPNKYREVALNAARDLLAKTPSSAAGNPADRSERDNLFSVLALYGDVSYVGTAQTQLVQADGGVDRSALKYLQQAVGQQSVTIAAQTWNDPRLTDPAKKEPLARVALNYVGTDPQANLFYQQAINDLSLPKDHRRNLIEDLNQDGFPNKKELTARDLPLVENRIALIEQLAPNATDPINIAAFKEAYKDLVKMRERIVNPQTVVK